MIYSMTNALYYRVRHLTKFRYSGPIRESAMEVHMQPRSDANQRCISFELVIHPKARSTVYVDWLGNTIHTFNIPAQHSLLTITARAMVDMRQPVPLPTALAPEAWHELDVIVDNGDYWDALMPTPLTQPTDLLHELAQSFNVERRDDPLTLLRELNTGLYNALQYKPKTTKVDSPIDDALQAQAGVCQDFSHIMLAMVRELRIPARYVSGYLAHRQGQDRSAEDATHAWVEALLPGLGWVGFDPTNNLITEANHIRVGIGRDYNDVPPTRGVFKGKAETELSVAVHVALADDPAPDQEMSSPSTWVSNDAMESADADLADQQQQQQQQ